MQELIDRQAAIQSIKNDYCSECICDLCSACEYRFCIDILENAPTIEAGPVRHGRWIALEGWFNKSNVKCSVCGNTLDMDGVNAGRGDANFCPNCGADMREEGEQE